MKINVVQIAEFLRESNAIEGVYDAESLGNALIAWDYIIGRPELTVTNILRTHKILMTNQPIHASEKGHFRKFGVSVGGRLGATYFQVPSMMATWCDNVNDNLVNSRKYDKEFMSDLIKKQHVSYEFIHPFVDGNGRTGRIFMNWSRVKQNLPILTIKESEKYDYYTWFQ